jgi:hypothetical protein
LPHKEIFPLAENLAVMTRNGLFLGEGQVVVARAPDFYNRQAQVVIKAGHGGL